MPVSDFKKTKTQKKAIDKIISSGSSNIMLYGSSRSGKTFIAVYILIVRACKEVCDQIIVRNTFNSVKNSIWLETLPKVLSMAFPGLTVKWDRTNYRVIFPNGSTIRVAGLDAKDKIERLLGLSFSGILAEECNQIPFVAIERLKTRLAQKNDLKKIIIYTQNPTKTSSAYYQLFEQGVNPVDGESLSKQDYSDFVSIQMNVQGNIENIDRNYVKMLEKLPEKERLRFLQGEYDSDNTGAAVYAFSDDHVSEEAKKLQGTIYCGVDFNISNNADVLISQHAHGIYVWDEQLIAGDTFKKADGLKKKGATGATVICDSTGKARRTSGMSDHEILKQNGFNVVYKTNPAIKDKIANLNRALTLGLIKIHPRCKKLCRDLKQLEWKSDGQKLDSGSDDSLGHLTDCLAYAVWYLYPLQDFSKYKITSQGRF